MKSHGHRIVSVTKISWHKKFIQEKWHFHTWKWYFNGWKWIICSWDDFSRPKNGHWKFGCTQFYAWNSHPWNLGAFFFFFMQGNFIFRHENEIFRPQFYHAWNLSCGLLAFFQIVSDKLLGFNFSLYLLVFIAGGRSRCFAHSLLSWCSPRRESAKCVGNRSISKTFILARRQ